MTTAYILIAAILILGGVIATVGDRVGTRVGKARLSLFNLRPRNTANLISILTGVIISASTLGILFGLSEQLRTGVFELEEIQKDLRSQRRQLQATNEQKNLVEQELVKARAEQKKQQQEAELRQAAAQKRLAEINQSLEAAIAEQAETQAQLKQTQAQLERTQSQFQQAQAQLKKVSQQAEKLRAEIKQSQAELQQLVQQRNQLKAQIAQRDREIAKLDRVIESRDREISERNQVIVQQEARLKELETQQANLERNLMGLRRGSVALVRGQNLARGVVRITKPAAAKQAVDQLLREANRTAIRWTQPGNEQVNERVVKISEAEVEQIIRQISDGRAYVLQILSANNYVVGEKPIRVFANVALNRMVFPAGDVLSSVSAKPASMTSDEMRRRLELLLGAAKFRANSAGILGDSIQVSDNHIVTMFQFFEQLKQYNQAVEIKAIAAEDIYTAGPLKLELVAMQDGQVVFSTRQVPGNPESLTAPKPIPTPQQPASSNS